MTSVNRPSTAPAAEAAAHTPSPKILIHHTQRSGWRAGVDNSANAHVTASTETHARYLATFRSCGQDRPINSVQRPDLKGGDRGGDSGRVSENARVATASSRNALVHFFAETYPLITACN